MKVDREDLLKRDVDTAAQASSHNLSIVQSSVDDDDTAKYSSLPSVHGSTEPFHNEDSIPQLSSPSAVYSSLEHCTSRVSTLRINSPFSLKSSREHHMSEGLSLDFTALPTVESTHEQFTIAASVSEANIPPAVHSVSQDNVRIFSSPREQMDWWSETAWLRESSDEFSIDEVPFNMRRSDRCDNLSASESLPDQDNPGPSTLSPTTIADDNNEARWSGSMTSNENNAIQERITQISESDISWGLDPPTNIPPGWEFAICEDTPEEAYLSVPTPLEEGFYSQEEDKENVYHQPNYFIDSEDSEGDDLRSEIDWSEVAQRPRDAFGRPLGRDGRPAVPEPNPLSTLELSLRRGRPVLVNLLPPDGSDEQQEMEEGEID